MGRPIPPPRSGERWAWPGWAKQSRPRSWYRIDSASQSSSSIDGVYSLVQSFGVLFIRKTGTHLAVHNTRCWKRKTGHFKPPPQKAADIQYTDKSCIHKFVSARKRKTSNSSPQKKKKQKAPPPFLYTTGGNGPNDFSVPLMAPARGPAGPARQKSYLFFGVLFILGFSSCVAHDYMTVRNGSHSPQTANHNIGAVVIKKRDNNIKMVEEKGEKIEKLHCHLVVLFLWLFFMIIGRVWK